MNTKQESSIARLKISDCVINTFGDHYFLSDDLSLSKKLKELGDPVRILKYVQLYMISIADALCDPDLLTCHNIFFTKFEKENVNKKLSIVFATYICIVPRVWVEKSTDYRKFIH